DRPLKALRHTDNWDTVLAACPRHAHWADAEPLTDVLAMGGVVDRYRRMVVDGEPVATGVVMLGDAWACTNPSLGSGITLGLMHALRLRDFVRHHLEHRVEMAEVWDTVTEVELTPWYRATVAEDHARRAALEADRAGAAPPPPPGGDAGGLARLPRAAIVDADLFRALLSIRSCLALPEEVLARPGLAERVLELSGDAGPAPRLGPDRAQLLALLNWARGQARAGAAARVRDTATTPASSAPTPAICRVVGASLKMSAPRTTEPIGWIGRRIDATPAGRRGSETGVK